MKLSDIKLNPQNPRYIKDDKFKALVKSLKELPVMTELREVILDENNVIIGGNMRYRAGVEAGWEEIPAKVFTREMAERNNKLTGQEKTYEDYVKEIIVKDNISGGDWDWDLLSEQYEKEELEEWGMDVDKWVDDEVVEDEVPEVSDEPAISKLGEVYQLGRHRIMCGDSTKIEDVEKLMDGKKADMVFTDPPYGISFESDSGASIQNDDLDVDGMLLFNQKWQNIAYDFSGDDVFMMAWQSPRLFHLMDMFGRWEFFRLYTMYKSNRISYPHGAWINKTEPCLIFTKGNPKPSQENYIDDCYVYTHDKESHEDSNVGHPTPKPVKMIVENIRGVSKKDDIILDLFGGSGSTLIACEQTNRICYGCEIDCKYIDVIIKRWMKFTGERAYKIIDADGKPCNEPVQFADESFMQLKK